MRVQVLFALAGLAALACNSDPGGVADWSIQPTPIRYSNDSADISIPEPLQAGAAEISVTTKASGGTGCTRAGPSEIVVAADIVTIALRDSVWTGGCPLFLEPLERVVTVNFPAAGNWTLRFQGISRPGDMPFTIERVVTVQ